VYFGDSVWLGSRFGINGNTGRKGKLMRLDMSDEKAKGDSDMITMVKFSTNERLLAIANHSSIKLFEVKLIVQKKQFYLFEFETPPFCSEFSFF